MSQAVVVKDRKVQYAVAYRLHFESRTLNASY